MSIVPFLNKINSIIINPLLALFFVFVTFRFILSVIKVLNADPKDRHVASENMLWTVVGIFVIVSVYGIINLVLNSFAIPKPSYLQNKL